MDRDAARVIHEIPLERRTLHGHFSPELEPIVEIDSGDTVAFACLDSGWHVRPGQKFEPRQRGLDDGHALIGPVAVRGARPGTALEVEVVSLRVGSFGFTAAGGWSTWLNDRLGVSDNDDFILRWSLDADAGRASDDVGRAVELRPFLGVMGMPPRKPGVYQTGRPRNCGGNIDCKELVAGTRLFLPISVDGALFSAGDGHGRQGDGEISGTAIECPMERVELKLTVRGDMSIASPIAWTPEAWIAFGFDVDLDDAAAKAVDAMLDLMNVEYELEYEHALALASVVVDVRVTQLVNGVLGVHAVLPHDALRIPS